ncbi:MAG: peptidase E [Candidatus Saccharibacteria bacterium]|nr:peptidase E [Candidatus Saccharibacteria bacterium]
MRLFLASSGLGNYAKRLRSLAGSNRRVLIVRNARDYRAEDYAANVLGDKMALFRNAGFDPQVLDLQLFFGRAEELEGYLEQYDPGIIYCLGGNPFYLNAAMHLSGLDKIIHHALLNDAIVYAGESAGTLVATKNLTPYMRDEGRNPEITKEMYGKRAPLEALGLISFYPVCHAFREDHAAKTEMYRRKIMEIGGKAVLLDDNDAIVIDGSKAQVLRG